MMAKFTFEQVDRRIPDDQEMLDAFRFYDTDDSGYITHAELKAAMARIGRPVDDYEVEDMIEDADLDDEDGRISYEEFVQAMVGNK